MNFFLNWYYSKVARLLTTIAYAMATPIPEPGTKPGGGGYVCSVTFRMNSGSDELRCWGVENGLLQLDGYPMREPPEVELSRSALRKLKIRFNDSSYTGFGLLKGYWLTFKAHRLVAFREREYKDEMSRRAKPYIELSEPKDQVILLSHIIDCYCYSGPARFDVDSFITTMLRSEEWRREQESISVRARYAFILDGLCSKGILSKDGDYYRALPAIFWEREILQKDAERYERSNRSAVLAIGIQGMAVVATLLAAAAAFFSRN